MRLMLGVAAIATLAMACPADEKKDPPADVPATPDIPIAEVQADVEPDAGGPPRCTDYNPLRNAYFGDLHAHTMYSFDAITQDTRLTPDQAYGFAKGEQVGVQPYDAEGNPQRTLQLARPLDFVAITDHAEFLGEVFLCTDPSSDAWLSDECTLFREDPHSAYFVVNTHLALPPGSARHPDFCGQDGQDCVQAARTFWEDLQRAAHEHNGAPPSCSLTTFVAYEYSSSPIGENQHRNVIFRNEIVPELPIDYFRAQWPQDLWEALQAECLDAGAGCDVLAIPHNSNLASGIMFDDAATYVAEHTAEEARLRATMEPLFEIFQHKGDSECYGIAEDELCAFEKLPWASLAGTRLNTIKEPQRLDFAREILLEGLLIQQAIGVNPYAMGFIASTDTHLGTPGYVAEHAHPGHGGAGPPAGEALLQGLPDLVPFNPGGLAAVWAEENTREAIFEALRRRETWATSGPRIQLRLFAGWNYPGDLCGRDDLAEIGYAQGVPMGADLPVRPAEGGVPTMVVRARADSGVDGTIGTPLQRLQVIKGWVEGGASHFEVYDVAGDPANGASVDLTSCHPEGEGAASLCAVWSDPDFDPAEPAFYYARAIENPTCRWQQHLCLQAEIDCSAPNDVPDGWAACCDPEHSKTIQERAWSSPTWYVPQ